MGTIAVSASQPSGPIILTMLRLSEEETLCTTLFSEPKLQKMLTRKLDKTCSFKEEESQEVKLPLESLTLMLIILSNLPTNGSTMPNHPGPTGDQLKPFLQSDLTNTLKSTPWPQSPMPTTLFSTERVEPSKGKDFSKKS